MSRTSKYGKCIEQFDLKFDRMLFGKMVVGLTAFAWLTSDGGSFGPYFTILAALGVIGTLIFSIAPMCPGSTSLRACEKGIVFRAGFFSPLFLRWEQIEGFTTKEKEDGDRLLLAIDESAGIGKEWEFSLELSSPADTVASRLAEIWNAQRSEAANSIE